jgi:hypothetical protein
MHQMRISTNQVSSVVLRPKKLEIRKIVKTVKEPKKTQILCHEIEPNPSKDRAMHEGDALYSKYSHITNKFCCGMLAVINIV